MTIYSSEFLKKNQITSVSEIADSAGSIEENRLKLIDKNTDLPWGSIGETAGTRTITITFGSPVTIDRLILQKHTLATFTIKYNASSDFSTPISESGNTAVNHYYRFDSVTINTLDISITAGQTVGAILEIGQLVVTESFINVDGVGGRSFVQPNTAQVITRLSDLTVDKNFIKTNFNFAMNYSIVTAATRAFFQEIFDYNRRDDFYYIDQPEDSGSWNGVCGAVNWTNSDDFHNYTDDNQANGYNVNIQLESAGGVG